MIGSGNLIFDAPKSDVPFHTSKYSERHLALKMTLTRSRDCQPSKRMIRRGANYVENRAYNAGSPDPHSLLHSIYLLSAVIRHLFFMAVHPYLGALRDLTKSKMGGES